MSRTPTSPPAVDPISRPHPVATLSRETPTPFTIVADAAERAALARHLDIPAVEHLSFEGRITPVADGGFVVEGRLSARVVQSCVITLEPLAVSHDLDLSRFYVPAARLPALLAETASPDGELEAEGEEPEGYVDTIDPGLLATESLLLALDPYPRAAGAELGEVRAAPPGASWDEVESRPFAGLAELRRRLRNGGE